MRLLPLVAQQVRGDACQDDAAAHQALERSRPERHGDHEDAAQNKGHGDEEIHLQEEIITATDSRLRLHNKDDVIKVT